ncbi:MAG TPA: Rid family detoxifying hydrolase [Kofleriaceae bacterium]
MTRSIVRTDKAPGAIGPYSQAVVVPVGDQRMVFCSGQVALSPTTGQLLDGDAAAQARAALDNLGAVLAAAGGSFANVVKTTIFLVDMGDFQAVNAVYGERFAGDPPARSTVAVAGLPRNARVEIEAIAIL